MSGHFRSERFLNLGSCIENFRRGVFEWFYLSETTMQISSDAPQTPLRAVDRGKRDLELEYRITISSSDEGFSQWVILRRDRLRKPGDLCPARFLVTSSTKYPFPGFLLALPQRSLPVHPLLSGVTFSRESEYLWKM